MPANSRYPSLDPQLYINIISCMKTELPPTGRARLFAKVRAISLLASLVLLLASMTAAAQDLTPRSYWPAPKGTKVIVAGYAYSSGDIVTDLSLPVTGVDSKINSGVIAYQQTFSLLGRTTNVQFELPYVNGTTTGAIQGESARRDISGTGDISATVSINFLGAPSMTAEEFRVLRKNPRPILAASLKIVAPTGEYESDKLINIGSNRWATRMKLGYVQPFARKWMLEMAAGAWFFQDNDQFLGETREQAPILAIDLSIIRRFSPGFWVSLDSNYYSGGRTTISGNKNADFQRNSRMGATLAWPFKGRHAIKLGYSGGVATQSGGDYQTFLLSYLYVIN